MKNFFRNIARNLGYYSLPGIFIIGAQKSGTSALFKYLYYHPDLSPSRVKETDYLSERAHFEEFSLKTYSTYFSMPHHNKWKGKTCFEASPSYLYVPNTAGRIYSCRPDAKIIVSLREPVKRAFSAYTMYKNMKGHPDPVINRLYEERTFDEIVSQDLPNIPLLDPFQDRKGIIRRGLYYYQLLPYYTFFSKENIKIINHADLKSNTIEQLQEICEFLNISDYNPEYIKMGEARSNVKKATYKEEISVESHSRLQEFYAPHNELLFNLIGKRFDW